MNFSSKSPVLVFSTQYIGWPIATRRQSQKDGDGNNLENTERGEKGGRVDNLRMLSMAPCVKNLKIPKNTICKLENKQRNERQKKERMDYWRHMPTNHFLCICIFKKKEEI